MKHFLTRLLAPVVYWWAQWRRKPRVKPVPIPIQLLPLFDAASLVVRYCEFSGKDSKDLAIHDAIMSVINGDHTPEIQRWVHEVLFGGTLHKTTFDWMVALGDASEAERVPFRAFLDRQKNST